MKERGSTKIIKGLNIEHEVYLITGHLYSYYLMKAETQVNLIDHQ